MHERAWLKDIYSVEVKCVVETADFKNSQQLKKKLIKSYKKVTFNEPPFAIQKSSVTWNDHGTISRDEKCAKYF